MKKITSILIAVAFVGSIANAELLKNFKYNGSVEVNAYNTNNTSDFATKSDDKKGDVDTRVMINTSFDLNEDVNAVVSVVKNNRKYGENSENANKIQDNLFFEQAYLNLKGVLGMDHKLGRQYYGNPGDLVIYYGPKMWPYTKGSATTNAMEVNAIDAWTGWYKYGNWNINALLGTVQNDSTNTPDQDKRISGINIATKIDRFNLNAYYYNLNDKTSSTKNSNYLGVVGARANWECMFVKGLNLGLEYDANLGRDTVNKKDNRGYAFKANANYSLDLAGKLGFDAEYVFMSGDDDPADSKHKNYQPINGDYRPGIIYGGNFITGNYVTGSGKNIYNLGINWTPKKLDKLNIAAKYYDFSADKKYNSTYQMDKKHEGYEADIVATWNHSENVSVKAYYALFKPEKDNSTYGTNSLAYTAATMFGAAFQVKF